MNLDIWVVGQQKKKLLVKRRSLCQLHFAVPILFVLTLTSDRADLYWNVAFSILVVLTKICYFSF